MVEKLKFYLKDPLFKNSYFLMATTIIGSALEFFFWMTTARYYSPQDIGLATAMISGMSLVFLLSLFGLDIGLIRFLPKEKDKKGLINSCFTVATITTFLLSIVFIAGLNIWSPALVFISKETKFYITFVFFSVASSLLFLQFNALVALRHAEYAFIQRTLMRLLKIILVLLLTSLGMFGVFLSWGTAAFIAFIISISIFSPRILHNYFFNIKIKDKLIKNMMYFSFGNYLANILNLLPSFCHYLL